MLVDLEEAASCHSNHTKIDKQFHSHITTINPIPDIRVDDPAQDIINQGPHHSTIFTKPSVTQPAKEPSKEPNQSIEGNPKTHPEKTKGKISSSKKII